MYTFSKASKDRLYTCDKRIIRICEELIKIYDFTILEGYRSKDLQNLYYEQGKSKLKYPKSNHNQQPSRAIDIAPYPIDWEDRDRFYFMAGLFKGIAHSLNIKIRWGGDWNNNNIFTDQSFFDLPHFELIEE